MRAEDRLLVRSTWHAVSTNETFAAECFYDRLFRLDPSLRLLTLGTDLAVRGHTLFQLVASAVAHLEQLERVAIRAESAGTYAPLCAGRVGLFGEALLYAIERVLGADRWTTSVHAAWLEFCALLSRTQRLPVTAERALVA